MNKFKIYTSGAMKGLEPVVADRWRYKVAEYFWREDAPVEIFIPSEYFGYDNNRHRTEKQVMDFFLREVENSDIVLVNLINSSSSIGTAMEVCHAYDCNIPIIGILESNTDVHAWYLEMCTVVFDSVDEAIEYIKNYYVFRGRA